MTSSFTSMLLAAWIVLGEVAPEGLIDPLASAAEALLFTRCDGARELASSGYERVVYLGSGPLEGLAHESALKMLELTAGAVVTLFDSPMGFRHGRSLYSTSARWLSSTYPATRTPGNTTSTSSPNCGSRCGPRASSRSPRRPTPNRK